MADYSVTFSELDALLQSLDANTVDTPYDIEITEITNAQCTGSLTPYATDDTLQMTLQRNSTKYVSLCFSDIEAFTSIGEFAFCEDRNLTSIIIPNTVTSIGNYAFNNNTNLVSVTIPSSVTVIYGGAFYGCIKITSIEIPYGVTYIGVETFYGCSALSSITLPNSITAIYRNAFYSCVSLESVILPNSLKTISSYAFERCALISIVIPNSVTELSTYSFRYCTNLTTIYVEHSFSELASATIGSAFYGCSSLTTVSVENEAVGQLFKTKTGISVTPIARNSMIDVEVSFLNSALGYLSDNQATLESCYKIHLTDISHSDINCTSSSSSSEIASILNANSTKFVALYIGDDDLNDDVIENGYVAIGFTFHNCATLIALYLGYEREGFKRIRDDINAYGMCQNCTNLLEVNIEIKLPNDSDLRTQNIFTNAFASCSKLTSAKIISNNFNTDYSTFKDCTSLTTATVSNCHFMNEMFYGCTNLESVSISENSRNTTSAFYGCTSLRTVSLVNALGTQVESIENTAIIPSSVENATEMFKNCSSLTDVKIETPYENFGSRTTMTNAFEGCTSLEKVICHNSPAISETAYHAFRLALDSTNHQASVQCFDTNGNAVFKENNVATDIIVPYGSGTDLELKKKTNLLGYSSSLTDDKVSKMMDNKVPITSNSQTLDPKSKTFVLWGEDDGQGNANFKTNLSFAGAVIDDTTTSTSKTWSSNKIANEMGTVYPEGFVYMQLPREKNPAQLNLRVPTGCGWVDISNEYNGDHLRVKNSRWHPKGGTEKYKVVSYNSSSFVVTLESGAVKDEQCYNRDIVRYNGTLAWVVARTTEIINGVVYNKTLTLDRNLAIPVGAYISISQGDGIQHHIHSGTTGGASMYGGWNPDGVGFWFNIGGRGAPSVYNLSSANYRSGTATINHNHGFITGNATRIDSSASNILAVREETRVQCSLMTLWQVQII